MTDVQASHVERKLAAILAADVVGYSRLMGIDEEGTLSRLKDHRRFLFDPKITEHRGRIVKTTGDGLLVEFASVIDAVRCAVEVQQGMAERNAEIPAEQRIEFRIGINLGDIIIDGDDIYGDGVNVAARLETLADPGSICVSRVVRDQVRDKLDFSFEDLGAKSVKNIARPIRVHRVRFASQGNGPPVAAGTPSSRVPFVFSRGSMVRRSARSALRVVRLVLVLLIALIVAYRWVTPPGTPYMLVRLLATGNVTQHTVPLASISADLPKALIAGMDPQFCQHRGVVWDAGPDAPGGNQGFLGAANSITLQTAQNLFLWPGPGPVRKSVSIGLAYAIDLAWPKRRIVEVYLNIAEWGDRIYGAEAAAQAFFQKSASQLTRAEAASLVAALSDPSQLPSRLSATSSESVAAILRKIDAPRADYSCLR